MMEPDIKKDGTLTGVQTEELNTADADTRSIAEIFERLEALTEQLQDPSASLEEAFKNYQEGMQLVRACAGKIDLIEKKVEILGGEETLSELY